MTLPHGGNLRELAQRSGRSAVDLLDFSANINPLGPPPSVRAAIADGFDDLLHYPDPDCAELTAALAAAHGLSPDNVLVGNGSTELLFALAEALEYDRALLPVPCYVDYTAAVRRAGRPVIEIPLDERRGFEIDWRQLESQLDADSRSLVILGWPNNPTGRCFDVESLDRLATASPRSWFVVDEAFAGFVAARTSSRLLPNVILLRSLTKLYAIPGLRLGWAAASADAAARIRTRLLPWSVNALAQRVGLAILNEADYVRRTVEFVAQRRGELAESLAATPGFTVFPSDANYLLVRIDRPDLDACTLASRLLERGIAIRTFGPGQYLDGRFFRVAVRAADENERLVTAIVAATGRVVHGSPPSRKPTPALMIQGTSSNAGKSLLTAALCRILFQDGVRVAPFKSQNMSLNSFVTRDGGEMGRAQVVQAQACRLEPDVRMNPILLKPNSDTGCQVIVRGKPVGNMRVGEYVAFKPEAFAAARECYDSLAADFDAIVLEGAGSPGEVNLKHHDIVNMAMAEHARSPVLVVGDIDRGGVFASFVGTMEVLDPWEQRLVAGWVVNRFRGDASLLAPAFDEMIRRTGRPVLGVVPYLHDLNIPQEDSVEFKAGKSLSSGSEQNGVEIAVIDLPHLSNFTDFDAFCGEPDARLRIVRSADELGTPDAVLLGGSKNTLGDLSYLRASGLADAIVRLAQQGKSQIVGICGGFQMLGRSIRDPLAIESGDSAAAGLGLLDMATVMAAEKTLVRTTATHEPSGCEVAGYEIHHGQAEGNCNGSAFTVNDVGSVWGTYLHGVFDADAFRRWFLDRLRVRRGLEPLGAVCSRYDIEPALDRLAEVVRASLPIDRIYQIMGLS